MKEKILKIIETNSKISIDDISKMINESKEDITTSIAEMEADKIICGYHTIINWDKISDEKCTAIIEVKVTPQRGVGFDKVAERISRFDEVDSVYLMSGASDFIVQIKGKSMKEVSQFVFDKLSTFDTVVSTATHFVLKKYKDHGVNLFDKPETKRENIIL